MTSFAPCDLWVLPLPAHSTWFARVDWYLNWQLCKGLAHEQAKPSLQLFRVLEENGMHFEDQPREKVPLLVFSKGRIPATKCLVLECSQTLAEWLRTIHRMASDLKVQSLRVFLPKHFSKSEAQKLWQEREIHSMEIEFSSDKDDE